MKIKNYIFISVLFLTVFVLILLSCDNLIGLGERLDLQGPEVKIVSPIPRKAISSEFILEGWVSDNNRISKLLLTVELDNALRPNQWRYLEGIWEVSSNAGITWDSLKGAKWTGTEKKGDWSIPVNLGESPDGEYQFIIQAWDFVGNTDEKSIDTRVFIIDRDPPKVSVSNPYLYRFDTNPSFAELAQIPDNGDERFEPSYIGRFITQSFNLQWQIEDNHDVWSIDLRFYDKDTVIDNDPATPLPNNYIYKYFENLPPPPPSPSQSDYLKPNGVVKVPRLTDPIGIYDGNAALENPITEKTSIKVVAVCYDVAGNPNQEKTLGYFVYWPLADKPWIVFPEDLKELSDYDGINDVDELKEKVFMVYPGRTIRATAFQGHGVKEVIYSLYLYNENTKVIDTEAMANYNNVVITNPPRPNGSYSTTFMWDFLPPPRSHFYVLRATAYSSDNQSIEYQRLFRVQDITFPDFPEPVSPSASRPLFESVVSNSITISGTVGDATEIVSLAMVWINPESLNYAAMSQLAYFRDSNYIGWRDALALSQNNNSNSTGLEVAANAYDQTYRNRFWRLALTADGFDIDTNRRKFKFSVNIPLNLLNIGTSSQPLRSQVFLLRAENPDGKCTIITYAPQGDTHPPVLEITNVVITGKDGSQPFTPNNYGIVQPFENGDKIQINGTWAEDSTAYLPFAANFGNNLVLKINESAVNAGNISFTGHNTTHGTWQANVTIGTGALDISAENLKDTLVISSEIRDIGGNKSEFTASWLIESDHLKLMRISSENLDGTYKAGDKIKIFLEFNKAVQLTNYNSNPVLVLNSDANARASYVPNNSQSTRQYFEYEVGLYDNTATYLNVINIQSAQSWTANNYPFTWHRGSGESREEIRITNVEAHNVNMPSGSNYFVRRIPVNDAIPGNGDRQFTLIAGKELKIDTVAPVISSISAVTAQGNYNVDTEIYFNVNFSKAVRVGAVLPRIQLNLNNGTSLTETSAIKVTGTQIQFMYRVKTGDNTEGQPVTITGFQGDITDLAGTFLAANAVANFSGTKSLTGLFVDTIKPSVPTVRVLTSATVNDTNIISQTVNGSIRRGLSTATDNVNVLSLTNVYQTALHLAIQGNTTGGAHNFSYIEYSINGGLSWTRFPNTTNTSIPLDQVGAYNLRARQIDRAGNESDATPEISFNRDPGSLVSRVTSSTANGTYTHLAGRNQITITVHFRKNVVADASTTNMTLNARRGTNNHTIAPAVTGASSQTLDFVYNIVNNDSIPSNADLAIAAMPNIVVWDGSSSGNGVRVEIPSAQIPAFDANKLFKIATGDLTVATEPLFIENNLGGTGWNTEGNANFHGIRTDDGSYWTTLEIKYNHNINKGSGNIIIEQVAADYRIPTVLTETQYTKFRTNTNTASLIDTYYFRGTNGYSQAAGVDTSTKYVLQYRYNPNSGVTANNSAFTNDAFVPAAVFTAFRTAERISIPVSTGAVTISGDTLRIRLSGSNAPQVPGATYAVTIPASFVNDDIGNDSTALTRNVPLRGVAKPFVRIKKTQEQISTNTNPSMTNPRLTALHPFQAHARVDSRTPASTVRYTGFGGTGTDPWYSSTTAAIPTENNWTPTSNNAAGGPGDTSGGATQPAAPTATSATAPAQFTIGDETFRGLQWWVRTVATTSASTNNISSVSDEIAYRTVITYRLRQNPDNEIDIGNGDSILESGDAIWIRGGDAIGSSSVPGFAFTWDDNWNNMTNKRAGVRIMTKVNNTDNLNRSTWRFVTWDINVPAYIDFMLGRDPGTNPNVNVLWQFGPERFAYQRAGWTAYKDDFRVLPGKHRYCDTGRPSGIMTGNDGYPNRGNMNFSGSIFSRPARTAHDYDTWPGVNAP